MAGFNSNRIHHPQHQQERAPRSRAVERMRVHVEDSDIKPKEVDPKDLMRLNFKGNDYSVGKLLKLAGIPITFKADELCADAELVWIDQNAFETVDESSPVIAKYEGKYVVLLGNKKIKQLIEEGKPLSARLLSNPVLKNALVK